VTTTLVGARTAHQVRENAGAAEVRLTPQEVQTLRQTFEQLGEPTE